MIDINTLINSLLLLICIADIANDIHTFENKKHRMISISLVKRLNGYAYYKKIMTKWRGGGIYSSETIIPTYQIDPEFFFVLFRSYASLRLFLHLLSRVRAFSKVPRGGTTVARLESTSQSSTSLVNGVERSLNDAGVR